MKQKALMLGAGSGAVQRRMQTPWSAPEEGTEWTTLDYYVPADIKLNLWEIAEGGSIPIEQGPFHEIHAYEVLEHFGTQGRPEHFFNTFNWLHGLLAPRGCLVGSCPLTTGPWVWGDPGHSRVISRESLSFLEESFYTQCGKTAASDYRSLLSGKYRKVLQANDNVKMGFFIFAMQKQ